MRHKFRLGRGARLLPVLGTTLALAAIPSVASASSTGSLPDPQNGNVPYLAWNGEQVRMERCVSLPETADLANAKVDVGKLQASFITEAWTGNSGNITPTADPNSVQLFFTNNYNNGPAICAEGDIVSLYSGLASVELNVTGDPASIDDLGFGTNTQVFSTQILVAWMDLQQPTVNEMSASNFGDSGDAGNTIGDPTGTGSYQAGDPNGYVDVHVTGSLPTAGFRGLPSTLTLPNDWSTMANDLAESSDTSSGLPATAYWDTSGDSNDTIGNVPNEGCLPLPAEFSGLPVEMPSTTAPDSNYLSAIPQANNDNVDNCAGGAGSQDGPFSTVFGTLSGAGTSVGPFDPVDATDTDLPDGNVNAQDAPMPAALVNVSIDPNSGTPTSIDGVGSLTAANKQLTYSRDFTSNASLEHNLYAPFYDAYIPATARPGGVSSGIDGALNTQDFPGFSGIPSHEYHFWDTFNPTNGTASSTSCLRYSSDSNPENRSDPNNQYYQTPSGQTAVTVYTDQNGEAQVQYDPGTGFYFNNLGITPDGDNGCDLQTLTDNHKPIGTSTLGITANYPYKEGPNDPTTPVALTKTVYSAWSKTLTSFPKAAGSTNNPADADAMIVVAHAQDIDGSPFQGETVCFTAGNGAQGLLWYDGTVLQSDGSTLSFADTTSVPDPKGGSFGRVCVTTDENGNAAVEVDDSTPGANVDVLADFTNEGILRDLPVTFGSSGSGPNPIPGGTSPNVVTTISPANGNATPSVATVKSIAPALVKAVTHKRTAKYSLVMARVMRSHGRRYLALRIRSAHRSRIHIVVRYVSTRGHHKRSERITVTTNRLVKIRLAKTIGRLRSVHLG
ncbi:MAG TPA: hypothetical protein VGL69_18620 [Solirubrobacteraceae bacterium]|jgi:hypothetical protein